MVIVNSKTNDFMITIESLVDMGANVKLEVTPTDLKMFAESIIQRTIMAQQEEQKAAIQREAEETYLNTKYCCPIKVENNKNV